jgi:hypothetical protein
MLERHTSTWRILPTCKPLQDCCKVVGSRASVIMGAPADRLICVAEAYTSRCFQKELVAKIVVTVLIDLQVDSSRSCPQRTALWTRIMKTCRSCNTNGDQARGAALA